MPTASTARVTGHLSKPPRRLVTRVFLGALIARLFGAWASSVAVSFINRLSRLIPFAWTQSSTNEATPWEPSPTYVETGRAPAMLFQKNPGARLYHATLSEHEALPAMKAWRSWGLNKYENGECLLFFCLKPAESARGEQLYQELWGIIPMADRLRVTHSPAVCLIQPPACL